MAVDTLGCGKYEVYFKYRGGDTFLCRARNLTALQYGRKLNDVSEASVTFALAGVDGDCCGCAAAINPWQHEIAVYRDGEEVWCGPVTGGEIDQENLSATFKGKDLSAWFDRRWIEPVDTDIDFEEVDIIEIYRWILEHAYYKDPFNLQWFLGEPLNIPLDRRYRSFSPPGERWAGNYPMAGTEMRDLLKSGMDYTTLRRVLIAGNLQSNNTPIARFMDNDWQRPPTIVIVGTGMATEVGVGGGNGGYDGWEDEDMWIERPHDEFRQQFGLLQSMTPAPSVDEVNTYEIPNPVTQQALILRALKREPFVYIRAGTLSQQAPVTFDKLIPGRFYRLDLEQGCRQIRSDYMLTDVSVSFGEEGEAVAVTLVPPGLDGLEQ